MPKMKGLTYKIAEVDTDDVKTPNKDYLLKVNAVKVANYKEELTTDYPVCVCIKEGSVYSLLDGYHRLLAWKQLGHKKIKIIYGE